MLQYISIVTRVCTNWQYRVGSYRTASWLSALTIYILLRGNYSLHAYPRYRNFNNWQQWLSCSQLRICSQRNPRIFLLHVHVYRRAWHTCARSLSMCGTWSQVRNKFRNEIKLDDVCQNLSQLHPASQYLAAKRISKCAAQ